MVRFRLKLLHEKNEMETYTFYNSIPFDREYDGGEERGADLTESDAEVLKPFLRNESKCC
jgi:hypothetical protein